MKAFSVFDRTAFAALLIIFFAVPMTISFSSYDQFGLPKFFLAVLLCSVLSFTLFLSSFYLRKVILPAVSYIPILFFALMAVSCVFSSEFQASIWGSYKRNDGLAAYFAIFVVMLGIFNVLNTADRVLNFLRLISISTFILSIYGMLQFFGIDIWTRSNFPFEISRSFATFGNPNLFASFQVLVIPLYLFFIVLGKHKLFYYLATFVSVFALTSSGTRAAILALITGLLLLFFYYFYLSKRSSDVSNGEDYGGNQDISMDRKLRRTTYLPNGAGRALLLFTFITLAAIAAVSYLAEGPTRASDAVERLGGISTTEGSTAQRIEILKVIPYAAASTPLLGDGNGSFRFAFERYQPEQIVIKNGEKIFADNAHNIYLQYLVENGIFVMLSFMWLVLYVFFSNAIQPHSKLESRHGKKDVGFTEVSQTKNDLMKIYLKCILVISIVSYGVDMLFSVQEMVQSLMFWGLIAVYFVVADRSSGISFIETQMNESEKLSRDRKILLVELFGDQGTTDSLSFDVSTQRKTSRSTQALSKQILASIFWFIITILIMIVFLNARKIFEADAYYKASIGISSITTSKDTLVLSSVPPKIFSGYMVYRQNEINNLYNYSDLFDDEKALDRGIQKAEELLRDEPRAIDNYTLLTKGQLSKGIIFKRKPYFEKAVKTSLKGIKLSPYWVSGYKLNAKANFNLKNYREAYQSAETAFHLEPRDPETETLRDFYRAQMKIKETGILIPQD